MSSPQIVRVAEGDILTVTGSGVVSEDGSASEWHVTESPLHLGAGLYRLTGSVQHSVKSGTVAALEARLPRATEIIKSAAKVAAAIRRDRPMSLADKMKHLADRAKAVPQSLESLADKHLSRLDALEARGGDTFSKLGAVLDQTEGGIAAAEDALNQLTNGAPVDPN